MVEPAIAPAFRFWDLFFLPCWVTRILSANRQSQLPYALEPHQQGRVCDENSMTLTCDVMFAVYEM